MKITSNNQAYFLKQEKFNIKKISKAPKNNVNINKTSFKGVVGAAIGSSTGAIVSTATVLVLTPVITPTLFTTIYLVGLFAGIKIGHEIEESLNQC